MKLRLFAGLTALAVAVIAGGWLMGDDKKPDDPKVRGQLPAHFKKLGLTDAQVQSIYKIEASYKEKIDALQQQIDDLKKAEHADVDNVLTDAQKTALKGLQTGDAAPDKDKPATTPSKDKPATTPSKDKPAPPPVKDKAPPTTDK
jgi:TolA-binding protein